MALGVMALLFLMWPAVAQGQSVRQERRDINSGNALYKEGRYPEAIKKYKKALAVNENSDVAKFNLGLTQVRMAGTGGKEQTRDSVAQQLYNQGVQLLTQVAGIGGKKADLSSKANYNLGNLRFEQEDYAGAINFYKQALRLNPGFDNARRNLRIAQLRQQEQQQDKNDNQQDKDQDKDQNKDQQDKQDQQNQDQQQDQDQQDQDQQDQQPAENEMSQQAAEQILNAVENNEAKTRARQGNGEKAAGSHQSVRKW